MVSTVPVDPPQADVAALIAVFQAGALDPFLAAAAAFAARWGASPAAQNLLGALYANCGRFDLAEPAMAAACAAVPHDLDARFVHAVVLEQLGRHAEAAVALDAVLAARPDHAEAALRLGLALHRDGRPAEAEAAFTRAIALAPDAAQPRNNRGVSLAALGRHQEAIACFDAALLRDPAYNEARVNLADALEQTGDAARAEAVLREALAQAPGDAELHNLLGALCYRQGRLAEAEAAFKAALDRNPNLVDAFNNMGMLLHKTRRSEAALAMFDAALSLQPDLPELHSNRGFALQELDRLDEAIVALRRSLDLAPEQDYIRSQLLIQQLQICDWRAFASYRAVADRIGLSDDAVSPGSLLAVEDDPLRQLRRAQTFARRFKRIERHVSPVPAAPASRLRVGYFSADFHNHATMHLFSGVLREHDRTRFDVSAWSYGPRYDDDALRQHVRAHVDAFHDVFELSDAEVVARAQAAGLDIAVDLKGYTQHGRIGLFAHGLGAVQVSWLGFPGSAGTPFLDYLIADATVIPEAERPFYTEAVVHLPGSYQCNDRARPHPPTAGTRTDHGLPEHGFVFCCFNNVYKIAPEAWAIWMRLLAATPGSVLWLFGSNPWAEANLARAAAAAGVDPARLVFAPWRANADHLARLPHADLFLDTFIYNAHTTASDALWMGVPLVTCPGRGFAARVAASLLRAVGLPDMVADSPAAYETLALQLAHDPAALGAVRARLAANRLTTPLFDTVAHTRALERAYQAMHARRIAGLAPLDLAIDG